MSDFTQPTTAPRFDIAVVGAGPAGLAAAGTAAQHGASVVVIDSSEQPGGQFWRHRSEAAGITDDGHLHHGWGEYLELRRAFDAGVTSGRITYLPATSVWMAQREKPQSSGHRSTSFALRLTPAYGPGRAEVPTVRAERLILATGGYDRQLPVPGWELPGVMAAGGIQAFIKQNNALPGSNFVIGGTGPFLLPVAANIVAAGGHVKAVLESANLMGWLPRAHRAAGVPSKALEGAEYAWTFVKHRIPYRSRTMITEIFGDSHVEAVRTARVRTDGSVVTGSERTITGVDGVGLGWGFTPQLELPLSLGIDSVVDADGSLIATVDGEQRSSVPGLYLAGELTGVGGAVLAVVEGRIAGRSAARAGGPTAAERRTVARQRSFAQAMHLAHPVPVGWDQHLHDDTVVCRCEEVRAGELVDTRDRMAGADSRTQKGITRAGMGWCQGRVCGFAVSCLATAGDGDVSAGAGSVGADSVSADTSQASRGSLASSAKRPVAQPVPLGELADLPD